MRPWSTIELTFVLDYNAKFAQDTYDHRHCVRLQERCASFQYQTVSKTIALEKCLANFALFDLCKNSGGVGEILFRSASPKTHTRIL